MPKEYIVLPRDRARADEQGGQVPATLVSWSRDGEYVQLATVIQAGTTGALQPVEAEVDQGLFMDLDRRSINALMRVLRRARDQAFGADE